MLYALQRRYHLMAIMADRSTRASYSHRVQIYHGRHAYSQLHRKGKDQLARLYTMCWDRVSGKGPQHGYRLPRSYWLHPDLTPTRTEQPAWLDLHRGQIPDQ